MIWWLRAHRAGPVAAMVVVFACIAWASGSGLAFDGAIASPVRAGAAVSVALWLPLAVAATVCWAGAADEGRRHLATAVRSNERLFGGFVLAVVAAAIAALVPAMVCDPALIASVARNVVGLVGVAVVLRGRFGGAAASALTAGYLAIAALLGANSNGTAAWWAWPAADRVGLTDRASAVALLAWAMWSLGWRRPGRSGDGYETAVAARLRRSRIS